MRITNKMMTNNALANINRNKNNMNEVGNQKSTGMKIQRPSEDPIVAVRALRLRSNLAELNQFYEKNIPDAMSWMDITESSLKTVNSIFSSASSYCVQGSSETLTTENAKSIADNLVSLKEQIYAEGDSNYAGRYVFTGYKTDSSLMFSSAHSDLSYTISENKAGSNFEAISYVADSLGLKTIKTDGTDYDMPKVENTHRIRTSYSGLDATVMPTVEYRDSSGTMQSVNISSILSSNETNAYQVGPNEVRFIADTGEFVFGDSIYNTMRQSNEINIEYTKSEFKKGDLKPEHYFTCTAVDSSVSPSKTVNYAKENQIIQYEINFNQKLTINTQAKDVFTPEIGRDIEEISRAVYDVEEIQKKIANVESMIKDPINASNEAQKSLKSMLEKLEIEKSLKVDTMQKKFELGITKMNSHQDTVNIAVADLGSRYNRLELTEDRLGTQQSEFEDLMSNNEEVDIVDALIRYNSLDAIYTASLSTASKVVKNSLLDFI